MSRRRWGVSEDVAREQVIERMREAAVDGKIRVRDDHGLYQAARRAFGSWPAALEAAGLEASRRTPGGAPDTDLVRHLDAISPYQHPLLPAFMRERQVLGGRMLEIAARDARGLTLGDLWYAFTQASEEMKEGDEPASF